MIIGRTKSVCPVCFAVLDAEKKEEADGIYLEKECKLHGPFRTLIWEGDKASYEKWSTINTVSEQPVNPLPLENACPESCGLCEEHQRKGCCMLLEVTKRCNLRCPVCFASAGEEPESKCESVGDVSLEEIGCQYDYLLSHGGPFNIQLSGGEPTMRDDLCDIIRMGKEKGFSFFQLNTNGLRLAKEPDYVKALKKAGLSTVFLQFDGLNDEIYQTLRGAKLLDLKLQAIANCKEAGLGVCLVPVIAPGVNDHQVGALLDFAISQMPYVRGIHFQPISYFGRCGQERPQKPITIPKLLTLIEEQTEGRMKRSDYAGGGAENPYCSFHAAYLCPPKGGLILLNKRSGSGCCSTSSDDSRQFVEDHWNLDYSRTFAEGEMSDTDVLDLFLQETHRRTFTVSGMLFQDAWNLDLERLKRCYICEVDSKHGMVPFCAYNLTNTEGKYLYRT